MEDKEYTMCIDVDNNGTYSYKIPLIIGNREWTKEELDKWNSDLDIVSSDLSKWEI